MQKKVLRDVRFWIVFFLVLRLIGITNPPLETGHNWRQSLTNMITRNFHENGANLLYPTIDMAGEMTGIIGSEFPFFNYIIYLFNLIFDYSHWSGRLINLIASSLGLYYFYRLIKNLFDEPVAFNSTLVLTVSIWFAFSRKIMPDTFSVSLVIIGLYYAYDYLKQGYKWSLFLFFIFSSLGMLCKIPALSLFSVLGIVVFIKEIEFRKKLALYMAGTAAFAIVCLWYFFWVPYLLDTYHFQLYFPKGIAEGIREIIALFPKFLEKFYFSALQSFIALMCCLIGIAFIIKRKNGYVISSLAIITAVFLIFTIKTGSTFPLHNYYIISFVPVMALFAGYGIAQAPLKFQYALLFLIAIEGIANQQHDFRIKDAQLYKLDLEAITKQSIPAKILIIINGGPSPQDIYFSHRKGWTIDNADLMDPKHIDSLSNLGADFLVVDKTNINHPYDRVDGIYEDEHYAIYRLENKSDRN